MVSLYCDGASRGNPGPASAGFWGEENGEVIFEEGVYLGETTNNVAEWKGLLLGLQKLKSLGKTEVSVFLDSDLVVKQVKGIYKVKQPHLIPLSESVRAEKKHFTSFSISHVRREKNKKADELANKALDNPNRETGKCISYGREIPSPSLLEQEKETFTGTLF